MGWRGGGGLAGGRGGKGQVMILERLYGVLKRNLKEGKRHAMAKR